MGRILWWLCRNCVITTAVIPYIVILSNHENLLSTSLFTANHTVKFCSVMVSFYLSKSSQGKCENGLTALSAWFFTC